MMLWATKLDFLSEKATKLAIFDTYKEKRRRDVTTTPQLCLSVNAVSNTVENNQIDALPLPEGIKRFDDMSYKTGFFEWKSYTIGHLQDL